MLEVAEIKNVIEKILDGNVSMLKIPAQELAKEIVNFCKSKDIPYDSDEFMVIEIYAEKMLQDFITVEFIVSISKEFASPTKDRTNEFDID